MITLDALVLPSGLVWADEYDYTPVEQARAPSLTGKLLIDEAYRPAGRPITLRGQQDGNASTAWLLRDAELQGAASLESIRAALIVANSFYTLTLHDGRQFRVTPLHDGEGPLRVTPLPVYGNNIVRANPDSETRYFVNEIRLIETPL